MNLVTAKAPFRSCLESSRIAGKTVGLVPTMGALHAGHLSLVALAREECDTVAVTIFVNPAQFGEADDLLGYPRDLGADLACCEKAGADIVFAPSVEEMYPGGLRTTVVPGDVSRPYEGANRPGHFTGVATVVTKLFSAAAPCRAFFGEKDYQQLLIVRQLATDLDVPVDVRACPTVREQDGLAVSSRNRRLDPPNREAAPLLYRALEAGRSRVHAGERSGSCIEETMLGVLRSSDLVEPEYAAVADPQSLRPVKKITSDVRLLVAARVGPVRLIDNIAAAAGRISS